jgi:hypothetical protein
VDGIDGGAACRLNSFFPFWTIGFESQTGDLLRGLDRPHCLPMMEGREIPCCLHFNFPFSDPSLSHKLTGCAFVFFVYMTQGTVKPSTGHVALSVINHWSIHFT